MCFEAMHSKIIGLAKSDKVIEYIASALPFIL